MYGGGATASLDDIMTAVVAAVKTGTAADRAAQLPALDGALDHVTGLLTKQGVARNTLEQTSDQLAQNQVSLAERRSQRPREAAVQSSGLESVPGTLAK